MPANSAGVGLDAVGSCRGGVGSSPHWFWQSGPMGGRVAVLVDAENVLASERFGGGIKFETLVSDLRDHYGPTSVLQVFVGARAPAAMLSRVRNLPTAPYAVLEFAAEDMDIALAVRGMELFPGIDNLVLVSGDAGFVTLLSAAQRAGKRTTVISPIHRTSAGLATVADELLAPDQLIPALGGLIAPGEGADTMALIVRHFQLATRRIVVIDPYSSEQTIRMMAFGAGAVELTLVADRLSEDARQEGSEVIDQGGRLSIYRSRDLHDRFFVVDDAWFQSGGSLKDLGKRWTRISKIDGAEISVHEAMLSRLTTPNARLL